MKLKDILKDSKVIRRGHEWPIEEKFDSKAQQRFLYATNPEAAKKLGSKMTKKDYEELPDKVNEMDKKAMDKASKIVNYLVKYYKLKVNSARQVIQDLARFL